MTLSVNKIGLNTQRFLSVKGCQAQATTAIKTAHPVPQVEVMKKKPLSIGHLKALLTIVLQEKNCLTNSLSMLTIL